MLTHDSIIAWLRTKAGVTISQNDRENRRLASEFLKMMVDASAKQRSAEAQPVDPAPTTGLFGKIKRAVSKSDEVTDQ